MVLNAEWETLGTSKGVPNPVKLLNDLIEMGKNVTRCELALENKGIDPADQRDGRIVVEKPPPFLMDAEGAVQTYVF